MLRAWCRILFTVALLLPILADAGVAGKVNFAIGGVVVLGSDGQQRELQRGSVVNSGDTIVTHKGRAQIRFNDGAMVSLQPGTEFRVDEYRYEGREDGSERSFFSLLKGGLRTVTGLIGHKNRDTFRIKTSVATIGIRGTSFAADFDTQLRVNVSGGSVVMKNGAGELVLLTGQGGIATGWSQLPQVIDGASVNNEPTVPQEPGFSAGDNRDRHGEQIVVEPVQPPVSTPSPPSPPSGFTY